MINLDVVRRYYRVVTCCYSVIHKLHSHSNDASYNSTFYHTRWYYEYRETFRCGLTADSRLHIAMDCGHGSLVKLCGLMRIKFLICTPLLMGTQRRRGNCIHSLCPVLTATHKAATTVVVRLISKEVEWAKYNTTTWSASTVVTVTLIEGYAVMLFVCVGDGTAAKI